MINLFSPGMKMPFSTKPRYGCVYKFERLDLALYIEQNMNPYTVFIIHRVFTTC
jgi:hypothetical protein